MKPVLLRFQCFGPYMKEQVIDFEELEKNGLFLICGETGAGKTTILDAMCYALYGKSSGGLRGELDVMRCKLASKDDETMVEFTFDAGGKRYQFVRSLRYGRKKLNDYHNCMVFEDGNFVPIFENPKFRNVNQKAEEIIGLTYEQFRQVIILPQGQFERLLVSDSTEKEAILVSLFGAEKWQVIADELYNRVAERDRKLRGEIADIKSRLGDYECTSVEALSELIEKKGQEAAELEESAKCSETEEKLWKKKYEEAVVLKESFEELFRRQEKAESLCGQKEAMEELAAFLGRADDAEKIRYIYEEFCEAKKKDTACQKQLKESEAHLKKADAAFIRIQAQVKEHEAGKSAFEADTKRVAVLESARILYELLNDRKAAAQKSAKEEAKQKARLDAAKEDFDKEHQSWLQSMKSQQTAVDAYTKAQNAYLAGISGTLAEKLEPGKPCPVCGSTTHPAPAVHIGESVTEYELDELNRRIVDSGEVVERAASARKAAEKVWQDTELSYNQAKQEAVSAKASYEEVLKQKITGIETTQELQREIELLSERVRIYTEQEESLREELSNAQGQKTASAVQAEKAKAEAEEAAVRLAESRTGWLEHRKAAGFAEDNDYEAALLSVDEKNEKKETLYRFRSELSGAIQAEAEQAEKLQDVERPDFAGIKASLEEAEKQHRTAQKTWILAQQALKDMTEDHKRLSKRKEKYDKERAEVDKDLEFANRLRGRSGISLQRYVLGVMLSSITAEANHLLKNVHHGRYRLYRTNEIAGSGHKGGLELEVLDSQSNERRSVTTLSGGEKFLVALSLAIGLSAVVQAQGKGMRLGAMFIDEGFGTLDQNSIFDALEVLQGIQKANGLVGIISHVELLKNTIPSKIKVVKGKEGSECIL